MSLCSLAYLILVAPALSAPGVGAAEAPSPVLSNDRVALTLDRGAIASLIDWKTGIEVIAPRAAASLFSLAFSSAGPVPGSPFVVQSRDAKEFHADLRTAGGRQTATLDFAGFGDRAIHVICTATLLPNEPFVRWRLSAAFPGSLVLEEVRFPLCVLKAPLEDGAEDALVLGLTKGGVYRHPAAMKEGTGVSGSQPGSLAAQFGCCYGPRTGFYTAAYDGQGYPKGIGMYRAAEGLATGWSFRCFATNPYQFDFDVVTGVFGSTDPATPTDWRDAADLYKAWALTQPWCAHTYNQRSDIPAFMKAGPAMVRFGRNWLEHPSAIDEWLRSYWQERFPAAPLITAYWGWEKVESWVTPDYFPLYPSDQEFTDLVARTRKLGCHAFPWPSGYHWTLTFGKQADGTFVWDDRKRFDEIGRPHAVVERDGKVYQRAYGWLQGGESSCLCPGDPWTIDWWNREVAAPLARRGCELLQVDQVVGGSFPACYGRSHGHPPGPGRWMTEVFTRQLRTMLAACRKVERDSVVCFEEPNERFIHLVGIQDYRDLESPAEPASVFNYLYHEFLPTFQSNPRPGDIAGVAYCLVNGQIPHMVPSTSFTDEPAPANGGFERGSDQTYAAWDQVGGWQGQTWRGAARRDTVERHSGLASLCLENALPDDIVQVSQNVPVAEGALLVGHSYRLSAWMKTDHMAKPNAINFATFTGDIKSTGGGNRVAFPPPGGAWVRGAADFTVPENSALLRIMIHVDGPAKVWVDDVLIEEVRADGATAPVILSGLPPDYRLMRRWVELYHGEGRPYLEFGRMLHPPKLDTASTTYHGGPFPAIVHNAYRAPDGTEAVIAANSTAAKQQGLLHWKNRKWGVVLEPGDAVVVGAA